MFEVESGYFLQETLSNHHTAIAAKGQRRAQSPVSRDTGGATEGVGQRQGGIPGNVEGNGLIRLSMDFEWFGFFFLLISGACV